MYPALRYLVTSLYKQLPSTATPLTKLYYAYHCLCTRGFFKDALPLYEEVLGTELEADNPPSKRAKLFKFFPCVLL